MVHQSDWGSISRGAISYRSPVRRSGQDRIVGDNIAIARRLLGWSRVRLAHRVSEIAMGDGLHWSGDYRRIKKFELGQEPRAGEFYLISKVFALEIEGFGAYSLLKKDFQEWVSDRTLTPQRRQLEHAPSNQPSYRENA